MKNCFLSPVDAKKLIRAGMFALMGFAVYSHSAAALSATTPPVAIPYTITTVAGNGSSGASGNGGPATLAELSADLRAVAVDGQGNIYIADTGNNVIREVNAQTGTITVVAGGATAACTSGIDKSGDGCPAATGTVLNHPRGLAVDKAGNLYIAGYSDELIHKVDAVTGIMTQVAGELTGVTGTCTHAYSCASGTKGYTGDGGPATSAAMDQPRGVAVDNNGNIWIADTNNNAVREINAKTGIITTVAGYDANGTSPATAGFAGDGSLANGSTVELDEPTDVAFDSQNNAYIVDFNNHRIREISVSTGDINTIIGDSVVTGTTAAAPPTTPPTWPAPAATTSVGSLTKLAVDKYGNIYFADSTLSMIFFYDASAQTITPIAGEYGYAGVATGFPVCAAANDTIGDGCPATQAVFYQGSSALGMAIDGQNNLYIADPNDYRIRKVSTNLAFPATTAGTPVTQTIELHPSGTDTLSLSGITVGSNLGGFTVSATAPATCDTDGDTTMTCASVTYMPTYPGLQTAPLVVTSTSSYNTFGLTGVGQAAYSSLDPGTGSTLNTTGLSAAHGEAMDANGNLYIADTGNNRVVEISGSTQTTIAGTGTASYTGDGHLATAATLDAPRAVAIGLGGSIYIADTGNNVIRVIDPVTKNISTYAGGATTVCAAAYDAQGDLCPAAQATLNSPSGLSIDALGNLYIADTGDNLVRRVDRGTGIINLDAGLVTPLYSAPGTTNSTENAVCAAETDSYGDGCTPTQATLNAPRGLALDAAGDLFIADTGDNLIREINLGTGMITSVAGNGQSVFSGDNGLATDASLDAPQAVRVGAAGNLYIADTGNDAIRMVNAASGIITTLIGQGGTAGSAGGTGLVSEILLSAPAGIALDASGNLYVGDTANNRVLADNRNSADVDFGVNNDVGLTSAEQTVTVTDVGNEPLTFLNSPAYSSTDLIDFPVDDSAATACAGSGTLTVGENCTLGIAFAPQASTTYSASVTLPSNALNQATAEVQLSGTGKVLVITNLNLALTSPASGNISYGQSGTITATVTPTSGSGTPTGTIVFTVGGTPQPAVTLNSGTATLTLTLPPVGGLAIAASYSGDLTYAASNSSTTVNVAQDTTTTDLTASAATQTSAAPSITFTATVASNTTAMPTGTVSFFAGATQIGSPVTLNAQGQASVSYSAPSGTGYAVTATYNGNTDFATSTSAAININIPADFLATITNPTVSVPQGGSVQFTGVSIATQGGITGTVTLSCTGLPANSTCTFFPTTLTVGGTSPVLSTTLTITTNVIPLALQSRLDAPSPNGKSPILLGAAFLPALLFGLGWAGFRRRNWTKSMLVLIAAMALGSAFMLSGCSTTNATQAKAGITPTGTSTVEIVFTGPGGVTHSVPVTLTVISGS